MHIYIEIVGFIEYVTDNALYSNLKVCTIQQIQI